MLFQHCTGSFRHFLAKSISNLPVFEPHQWFTPSGEITVISESEVLSSLLTWTDIRTSWGVFLVWATVVFLDEGKDLSVRLHRCLPGILVLLSSQVYTLFLRMDQTVDLATPNVLAISVMAFFFFLSWLMDLFIDSDSSYWVHIERWPHQIPSEYTSREMNCKPFIWSL